MAGHTARVNGIDISYDDVGEGRALVLVHGHPFDRSMWAPQIAGFARSGLRIIAADLRGYGRSTVVPGTTRWSTFAHDVIGLLDHLGIGDATLAGVSMGGQIVMECYRLFPGRISALVLAGTFAQVDSAEKRQLRIDTAQRLEREGMRGYADDNLARMVAAYNVDAQPDVAAHVYAMMVGVSPAGAAAGLRGRADRPDYRDLLTTVSVPTLVLVGRDDEFTPVADAEFIRDRVPGATLVVVDGAGHLPNLEQPGAVDAALREFLTVSGTAAAAPAATPVVLDGDH